MMYLDNAATTEVDSKVLDTMMPYLEESYGNPATPTPFGEEALEAVEKARAQVASLIGAKPSEIYFTSGATESNNWALQVIYRHREGEHLNISPIEHASVETTAQFLQKMGNARVMKFAVDGEGFVQSCEPDMVTGPLISVMLANNETGVVQDIPAFVAIARKQGCLIHTDAAQAVGKVPVDVKELGVDMMSLSAHKIHGPKGVGALYVREGLELNPFIFGGHQENDARAGTHNVPAIVGMGKAYELAKGYLDNGGDEQRELTEWLYERVAKSLPEMKINGHLEKRLPGTLNVMIPGIEAQVLMTRLATQYGVFIACGSACAAKEVKPSRVLLAMGRSHEEAYSSIRISLGRMNTRKEIQRFSDLLVITVNEMRREEP
jgi:cysteine desulfurase